MDVLTFYIDDTAPAIVRRLSLQEGGDFDVVGSQQFRLLVRPLWGTSTILDVAMTPNVDTDELTYAPQVGDFDTEGIYRGWVLADLGAGAVEQTDEFQINVFAHAPGDGTRVGAVWRAARALEPIAWDALRAYPDYGDVELQRVIELAKLRVLPTTVSAVGEADQDLRVIDYIAKRVLVDNVLSAAISFWTNQTVAQSARGNTEEVVTYPDRIRAAEGAIARYTGDLERQLPEVEEILGSVATQYDAPAVNMGGTMLTPGLDEYSPMPISIPYWRRTGARW
jgi:hypothetical protein